MADALLAQSAIDRLTSMAHDLVVEGPSYRQPQKPGRVSEADLRRDRRPSHATERQRSGSTKTRKVEQSS